MDCRYVREVCPNRVATQAVTFDGTSLVLNIPAGSYRKGCKYCIWINQPIPTTTTIYAPVVVTIGTGTVQYPLTNRCCAHVTACGIREGYEYAVSVATTGAGGTFRMLGRPACTPNNALDAIDGTAPATGGAAG